MGPQVPAVPRRCSASPGWKEGLRREGGTRGGSSGCRELEDTGGSSFKTPLSAGRETQVLYDGREASVNQSAALLLPKAEGRLCPKGAKSQSYKKLISGHML